MQNWEKLKVLPGDSLKSVLEIIERFGSQIVLVVDEDQKLVGTLTDGDARRGMLSGENLDTKVSKIMNANPNSMSAQSIRSSVLREMRHQGFHQMPLLDEKGRVVGLEIIDDFFIREKRKETVLIMAGGLGSRLADLTKDVPKPMLNVGGRPMLLTIIQNLTEQGFENYAISVNYKADVIENYFEDGSKFGVNIEYLRESKKMGTAGSLGLLKNVGCDNLLVTNGDVLVKEDFSQVIDQHKKNGASATMCTRSFDLKIPYGVIREKSGLIHSIEEKPTVNYMVNAGVYIISIEALQFIPEDVQFDMTDLFNELIKAKKIVMSSVIKGYWIDVGRLSDYEKANAEFEQEFL